MARISTYAIDGTPVSSDKVIGTDSSGTTTKNYPLGSVSDWLKESGASAVLGQNNYSFQIALDPDAGRLPGSFSFENYGGDGAEFINVSRLTISKSSSTGKYVGDYLLSTVGDRVMLGQLDDLNSFGVYTLVSLVQNSIEPTFYDAELLFVEGNGALQGNKSYGLATYSASASAGSAVWGSIEGTVTNQTDLVDYIDAEIAAIPTPATPTLQSVTDEGNTTTNNIGIGTSSPSYPLHVVGNSLVTGTQFIGDTFTRIQQGSGNLILSNLSSNGSVVLRTNSVEQMRLTSAGRVGIGTTNPISKLELQDGTFTVDNGNIDVFFGGISIDRNSANNTALKVNQRGTADIFALQDDGTDVLTIIDGGNVGIGTTEPGSTLPSDAESGSKILQLTGVSGSAGDTAILLRSLDNSSGFDLWHNASSGDSYIDNRYFYGDTIFRVRTASTPNEVVRITPDGNVGIGTTAPGYPLHIVASNNSTVLGLDAGSNARFRFAGNSTSGYTSTFNIDDTGLDIGHDSTARSLNLKTGNQDRLTILGSGNVGIGTTAPLYKLEVVGDARIDGGPFIIRGTNSFTTSSDTSGVLFNLGSGIRGFRFQNNNGELIRIDASGNVGIGTTAPDEKLRVQGNVKSAGDFIGSAVRLGFAGTANITTYDTNEDLLINPSGSGDILMQTTSGNVGIGTTAPAAKLDVNGSIYPTTHNAGTLGLLQLKEWSYVATRRITGENNRMELLLNGNVVVLKDHNTIGEGIQIRNRNNVVAQFGDATGSGNVGIGTTAPTEKLHVDGNALIENNLHVRGELTIGKIVNDTELVDIGGNINYDTVEEPGATDTADFVATILNEPGNIDNGSHTYTVIYKTADGGETGTYNAPYFKTITIVDNATAGQVELTGIPVSTDARVVARDIYRSEANGSPYFGKKLATINDNTTTTYVDNLPDSALDQDTLFYRKANTTAGVNFIDGVIISQAPSPHRTSYGFGALQNVTIGQDNVAIGGQSLTSITSGKQNTAVGYATGTNSIDGQNNTFIGYSNGYYNDSGDWNTYVGSFAGRNANNTTNNYNTGIGGNALNGLTLNNSWNTALGYEAGKSFQGAWNIHIGYQSGRKSTGTTTGDYNINLGTYSGRATTGSNNVVIGYGIEVPTPSGSDQLNIGNLIYATGLSTLTTASAGNVGIGTTAPSAKLHVEGGGIFRTNTGLTPLYITRNGATTESLAIYTNDTGTTFETFQDETAAGYGSVTFKLDNGAPNTGFDINHGTSPMFRVSRDNESYIVNSGNFGINTTSPAYKLHVNGNAFFQNTISLPDNAYVGLGSTFDFHLIHNGSSSSITNSTGNLNILSNGGDAVFSTSSTERMRITSAGNVGIGTTAPDSKLHVKATSGIAFKVDPNSADKEWYIDTTNPDHLKKEGNLILNADPTNVHASTKISFNIDGSNKASINSDGDLGVGTTAQTSKLHVDGTAMRQLRIGTAGGPSSNTDTSGAEGDIAYDDLYLYIKTGSGWGRVALDFAF